MKMICPHCGLGGTADVARYGIKVRCPQCLAVFTVSDEVVVGLPLPGVVEPSIIKDNHLEKHCEIKQDNLDSVTENSSEIEEQALGECSKCGFSFSREFLNLIDDQLVCPACAG